MHARQGLDRAAALILLLVCATWGLNQVAVKVTNAGISPVLQAGLRSVGSAVLVLIWSRLRGVPLAARDGTLGYGVAAGLLFTVEFVLIYWGLALTTASRGVIFIYTAPFVVAVGAHLFVPGDRLTRLKLVGLLAAFGGLVIAFAEGLRLPSHRELLGDLLCLAAAVLWGATTVLIKASPLAETRAEKTLLYQLGVSALTLPVASLLLGEPGIFRPTPLVLSAFAYQTVVVAFASYVTWFWLITKHPASSLAAFSFLTPVFGVMFGGLLLGEPITPALAASVALLAAGIYLVNRPA
jgi:drug/metabolite transporter (DMT)-like permease